MNLLLLASLLPCETDRLDLGWSARNKTRWWKLDVPCRNCQKHVTYASGIICTNYGETRGTSRRRQGEWCAEYFTAHELVHFQTAVPRDFNGASLEELEDEVRFRKARAGDHLCCAFQCPNCQSQNIRGEDLRKGELMDEVFTSVCIWATLDAF